MQYLSLIYAILSNPFRPIEKIINTHTQTYSHTHPQTDTYTHIHTHTHPRTHADAHTFMAFTFKKITFLPSGIFLFTSPISLMLYPPPNTYILMKAITENVGTVPIVLIKNKNKKRKSIYLSPT